MPRAVWKGPFLEPSLLKKLQRTLPSGTESRTQGQAWTLWSRRSVVLPQALGLRVKVHNGRTWVPLLLQEEMVGHKLGEFVPTRTRPTHKDKTARHGTKK